jgi:hypothetical protein
MLLEVDAAGTRKGVSIHALAAEVAAGPPDDAENRVWKEDLGRLLNCEDAVWRHLYHNKFEEDASGWVTFNIYHGEKGGYQLGRHGALTKIEVCLTINGEDGKETKITIGGIKRIKDSPDRGVAFKFISPAKTLTERLAPEDEQYWEVIVGTIRRAAESCPSEDA